MGNKKRPLPICRGRKKPRYHLSSPLLHSNGLTEYGLYRYSLLVNGNNPAQPTYAHNAFNLQLRNVFSCLLPLLLSPTAGSLCRLKFKKRIHSSTFFLHSFLKIISNFEKNVKSKREIFSFLNGNLHNHRFGEFNLI